MLASVSQVHFLFTWDAFFCLNISGRLGLVLKHVVEGNEFHKTWVLMAVKWMDVEMLLPRVYRAKSRVVRMQKPISRSLFPSSELHILTI